LPDERRYLMKHNHRLLLYRYAIIFKILKKIPWIKRLPIMYISGSEALPPPLTNEEENDLLFRLEQGDASVKSTLIERNLRLVVYIARKFENTGIGVEDLVSIGTIGLIKAVNTFDPSKRIKLATYASRCIENEILMYLRRNCKIKSEISFDEPLNIDWDGNELLLSDILGTENDLVYKFIEDEVEKELLCIAMNKLSKRERRIMELRFGLGNEREKTQKEVADMLGISQSYISRLEKRIIKRLKKEINRMV
jgi:RNA polymerase sporulation-specific sigma factor